jgi:hypothetical protein
VERLRRVVERAAAAPLRAAATADGADVLEALSRELGREAGRAESALARYRAERTAAILARRSELQDSGKRAGSARAG